MTDKQKIVMLSRSLLHPHPDNPRKDLGDLEELKESIRAHGIMQNLTVVPDEGDGDGYKILIGHRRFAASEGIVDELPCVVAKGLTDREQVGIMLCENMQRADLTYLEQAHGFQLMLDLGDTVETISQKTGFSKQTVKHRLAINEIDKNIIKEAEKHFQLSISDFIELEKIKDVNERNELLSECESSEELKDRVKEYIEDLQQKANYEYYKKIFEEAGWIDETEKDQWFYYGDGYKTVDGVLNRLDISSEHPLISEGSLKKLMADIKGEVHFGMCYHAIMVRTYKKPRVNKNEEEKEKARKEKEARIKKNRKSLREIRAQICDAYLDFILNSDFEFKDPKQELGTLCLLLDICRSKKFSVTLYELGDNWKYALSQKISLKGYNKSEDIPFKDFVNWTPVFQLLANMWWSFADSYQDFSDVCNNYPNKEILTVHKIFIDVIKDMGFQIKDEWKPVLDGTSELYEEEEK